MGRPKKTTTEPTKPKRKAVSSEKAKADMSKGLQKITVLTRPNGYTLDIEGRTVNYFYWSLPELVEGFLCRVGMEETAMMDKEEIQEVIAAAIAYKNHGELIKRLGHMNTTVHRLQGTINALQKKLDKLEGNG